MRLFLVTPWRPPINLRQLIFKILMQISMIHQNNRLFRIIKHITRGPFNKTTTIKTKIILFQTKIMLKDFFKTKDLFQTKIMLKDLFRTKIIIKDLFKTRIILKDLFHKEPKIKIMLKDNLNRTDFNYHKMDNNHNKISLVGGTLIYKSNNLVVIKFIQITLYRINTWMIKSFVKYARNGCSLV